MLTGVLFCPAFLPKKELPGAFIFSVLARTLVEYFYPELTLRR